MKFKEMSCEELKEDFQKTLDNMTDEELYKSLEKYIVEEDKMIHICNDCENKYNCKQAFKDKSGMLCSNIFFQKEKEIEWRKKREQENNSV
jgi:hypothetical protein